MTRLQVTDGGIDQRPKTPRFASSRLKSYYQQRPDDSASFPPLNPEAAAIGASQSSQATFVSGETPNDVAVASSQESLDAVETRSAAELETPPRKPAMMAVDDVNVCH